ncbi:hypothetical protein RUM43_015126 [Polyplax serrata]|uniref:Uncharacterized protein n=1 Tax=Polyplax serrata TaxID=468196 RepID=A0AAN8P0R8_POLSC
MQRPEEEAPNPLRIQPTNGRASGGHYRGKPGQGSKARHQERFRTKINSRQANEDRRQFETNYGINTTGDVEKLFSSVECTEAGFAVLLPIATRGVGFASVLEYQRFNDTESMTIHQYYRVMMYLLELKDRFAVTHNMCTHPPKRPQVV